MVDLLLGRSAVLSQCGAYRYRLDRDVQPAGKVFAYFGVNPSTADADIDDATVRKWRGFTIRNGGRKFIVGNVFAFRATNVRELGKVHDPVGRLNNDHILEIISEADILVPCWGNISKVKPDLRCDFRWLLQTLTASGKPVLTFGETKSGDPLHALMLSYETPLRPHPGK